MNDVRDESLGALLEQAATGIELAPVDRLPEVLRRGSRRRAARFTAIGSAIAIFVGAVSWVSLTLPNRDDVIPADITEWQTFASLESDGWTIQVPPSWRTQEIGPCNGGVIERAAIVTNVDFDFRNRDGDPVGCWQGIVWAGFPHDGVAFAFEPDAPFGISLPVPLTRFPLTPDELGYRDQVKGGPLQTSTQVGIPGEYGPVAFVSRWVGPDASATDVAALDRLLGSLQVRGAARWTERSGAHATLHDEELGYAVTFPDDWTVADENLTPWLSSPGEILSLGTFPLEVSSDPDDGLRIFDAPIAPKALEDMTSGDAFVSLQESGGRIGAFFDPRPDRFGPLGCEDAIYGCRPSEDPDLPDDARNVPFRGWWIPFQDSGRGFYLFVAIGNEATPELREEVWAVADSLVFDPVAG